MERLNGVPLLFRRKTRDESFSSSFFGLLARKFLVRSREMWCIAKEKASG